MANVTPDNSVVWFEIPVTDMKRARACCESVLAFNRTPDRLALNHLKRIQEKNQQL